MNANTLVRSIVRERVRRHFGLLSEAVQKSSQTNDDGITVELGLGSTPQEDTFVVSNAGPGTLTAIRVFEYADGKKVGEDLYNYNAERAGEDALVLQPGQNWSYDGTSINLRENVNLRVSYTVVDDKGGTQTRKLDFPMGAREAAAEAAPAAPESPAAPAAPEVAAAGAGTSTAPGVLGVGVFGEYSVDVDRLILLPRDTYEPGGMGMLVVRRGGDKEDRISAEKGIPVELLQSYRPDEKYYIFSSSYDVGDGYDLVVDGKVESFQEVTGADGKKTASSITPPPLDPAVREIEAGGPSAAAGGGATSGETKPTYMPKEGEPGSDMEKLDPQLAAGDVQQKIRNVGVAVKDRAFSDITEEGIISVEDVAAENALAGHTWITNSASDRAKFNLDNWSDKWGDPYTYFALVNDETEKPIAFVVASDPQDNNHFSTGRFIGPDSKRPNLRRAFCYLYHRATGEVHETCVDGPTAGPDDDRPKGSGGGGGRGAGRGTGGGAGTGGSSGGAAGTGGSIPTGGASLRLKTQGTNVVRGKGDAQARGFYNVALERVTKGGRKFYTRSKKSNGFDAMGPGDTPTPAILKKGKKPDGENPKTIIVVFKNPVNVDTTAIATSKDGSQKLSRQLTTLAPNKSAADIQSIGFYYKAGAANIRELLAGVPRSPGSALGGKFTMKDDPEAFQATADWIFSHPEQFDLAEDIEFSVAENPDAAGARGVAPDVNRGETFREERAINEARRTRSLTPLFDRYRF